MRQSINHLPKPPGMRPPMWSASLAQWLRDKSNMLPTLGQIMLDLPATPILYRPNVAAILLNAGGEIFVAERINIKGAWQFPQGGIDEGEDAETALFRELAEEIGVAKDKLEVLSQRSGYRYAFPKHRLKYGIYGGQEQTYFLCRFLGTDADVDLAATHQEFVSWKWIRPEQFQMDWVPKFKRSVYRQVLNDFFQIDLEMPRD